MKLKSRRRPAMSRDELLARKRQHGRVYYRAFLEKRQETGWMPHATAPPAAVLAEAARAAVAPRDLTAIICGDPPPGRRAIDQKENRPCD